MRTLRKLRKLAVLSMTFPLAACGTVTAATDSGCKSFRPIRWSKADTTQTQREVVAHNRAFDAICK